MTLCLCSIVKNDALVVRRMLESAAPLVDEIVIVDTGSDDNTMDVIREFSIEHDGLVKLLTYEWNHDFAAARNFGLDHVESDWVFVLDADEFVEPCDKTRLIRLLESTPHDGFFVRLRNYTGSLTKMQSELDIDVVRLFRSRYRYVGVVHEQIAGSIRESGGTIGFFPNLRIHHIGYTVEYQRLKQKNERNTRLLEKQLETVPRRDRIDRWFARSNLLAELHGSGQWERLAFEARLLIEEIRQEPKQKRPVFLSRIYKMGVLGYRNNGRLEDAIRLAKEAVNVFPKHTDLHFMLAETYAMAQRYVDAMAVLQTCRNLGEISFDVNERSAGAGTFLAARLMANCWLRLGDDLSAREWFVRSFSENTEQPFVIPWIILLTPDQKVLHELEKIIRTPQRYAEFAEWYAIAGYEDANVFIKKAREKWGNIDGLERAQVAYDVRDGKDLILPPSPQPLDYVRWGLWLYERGEEDRAEWAWQTGGGIGEYLLRVARHASQQTSWELKYVFMELLATKAVRFLENKALYASDRSLDFVTICHTDLIAAFHDPEALQAAKGSCPEEWEWQAQLWLGRGKRDLAAKALDEAKLPDGHWTVKGYVIAGDIYPERRFEYLRAAKDRYAGSEAIRFLWRQFLGLNGSGHYEYVH